MRLIWVHRKHQPPQGQAACAIFAQQSLLRHEIKPIYTWQLRETDTMRAGQASLKKVYNFAELLVRRGVKHKMHYSPCMPKACRD